MNAIDQAIENAKNTALANAGSSGSTAVGAVSNNAGPAKPYSLDDMAQGGLNVDTYLKVKEHGLLVGDTGVLFDEIEVSIDMTQVQVTQAIKFGDPATYFRTIDGSRAITGGSWDDAVARAQRADPKATPYMSADLPMTLTTELKDKKGEKVLVEVGTRIGHSLSTTNKQNFVEFHKAVKDAGLQGSTVSVKLTAQARSNKKANTWGVVRFELLGEESDGE